MTSRYAHPAAQDDESLFTECEMRRERRGGPGGQRRNKVETAIVLIHKPTATRVEAAERRSAEDNRRAALFRLKLALAREIRCSPGEAPSVLWQSRSTGGRIRINAQHTDFPAILAEAFDAVVHLDFDLADASAFLGCTTSQLKKLLQQDPPAWQHMQAARDAAGLRRLK